MGRAPKCPVWVVFLIAKDEEGRMGDEEAETVLFTVRRNLNKERHQVVTW